MMKGLCLISTGLDSPVAAFRMQRVGWQLDYVHFLTDKRAVPILKKLIGKLGKPAKLYIIPQDYMGSFAINRRFTCIICKRMMYRFAEALALEQSYDAIVTGENLGQVASQTLTNLVVLAAAIKHPIVRPLLSFDKVETIDIAKRIGTYDLSISLKESCPFLPKNPSTKARLGVVEAQERSADIQKLVELGIKKASMIELK
jgi:tRNA uracil 4-sulfurtransferase